MLNFSILGVGGFLSMFKVECGMNYFVVQNCKIEFLATARIHMKQTFSRNCKTLRVFINTTSSTQLVSNFVCLVLMKFPL